MLKVGDVFKFKTVSLGRKFYNKEFEVVTISPCRDRNRYCNEKCPGLIYFIRRDDKSQEYFDICLDSYFDDGIEIINTKIREIFDSLLGDL